MSEPENEPKAEKPDALGRALLDVVESMDEIAYRYDYDTGSYDYISPRIQTLTGYSPDEIVAMGAEGFVEKVVHPDDRERVKEFLSGVRPREGIGGRRKWHLSYRITMKDGAVRHISVQVCALTEHGRVRGVVGILRDATTEHTVTETLARSESSSRMLFDNSGVAMAHIGPEGEFLRANGEFLRLTGYAGSTLKRKTIFELVDDNQLRRLVRRADELRKDGVDGPRRFDGTLVDRRRRRRDVRMYVSPLEDGRETIVTAFDVTEERELSERTKRRLDELEALRRLASRIARLRSLKEMAEEAASEIIELMDFDIGGVSRYDEYTDSTVQLVTHGFSRKYLRELRTRSLGELLTGRAVRRKETVVVRDATNDSRVPDDLQTMGGVGSYIVVPLVAGGHVVGSFGGGTHEPRDYTEDEIRLLETACDQLAVAFENARLLEVERQRAKMFHLIHEIGQGAGSILQIERVLDRVVRGIRKGFGFDHVNLFLSEGERTFLRAFDGELAEDLQSGFELTLSRGLVKSAISSGEATLVPDVSAKSRYVPDWETDKPVSGELVVVLKYGRERLGAVEVKQTTGRVLTSADLDALSTLADQIAAAVANARAYQRAVEDAKVQTALREISGLLASTLDFDLILQVATETIGDLIGVDAVTIYVLDEDGTTLRPVLSTRESIRKLLKSYSMQIGEGITGTVAKTRQALLVKDTLRDKHAMQIPGTPVIEQSTVAVPLIARGQLLGVIVLDRHHGSTFAEDHLQLLKLFGNHMSSALHSARAYRRVVEDAEVQAALREVSGLLSSSLDFDEIMRIVVERVQDLIGADASTIHVLSEDERTLRTAVTTEGRYKEQMLAVSLKIGEGMVGEVAKTHRPLLVNEAEKNPRAVQVEGTPVDEEQAFIAAPLLARGELLGVISLNRFGGSKFFEKDLQLLTLFANQTAAAVHSARIHAKTLSDMREQADLREASTLLSTTLDFHEILRIMIQRVQSLVTADAATIHLLNDDGKTLKLAISTDGRHGGGASAQTVKVGEGTTGEVARTRRPLMIDETDGGVGDSETPIEEQRAHIAAPLIARDELLGVLALERFGGARFFDHDLELLILFANHTAAALHSALAHVRALEDANEQSALRETAMSVASTLDLQEVLSLLVRRAHDILDADTSTIFLLEDDGRTLRPIVTTADEDSAPHVLSLDLTVGQGFTGIVAERRESVLVDDASVDSRGLQIPGTSSEQQSLMAVPLVAADEMLGVILVNRFGTERAFTKRHLRLLEAFAAQSAVAIRNVRSYARERRRVFQMSLIAEVGRRMLTILDPRRLVEEMVRDLVDRFEFWGATVVLLHPDEETAEFAATAGGLEGSLDLGELFSADKGLIGACLASGTTVYCPDVREDPRYVSSDGPPALTELVVPLNIGERVLGALDLQMQESFALDPDDIAAMETLAGQAAIAFENARLYRAERYRSTHLAGITEVAERATSILELDRLLPEAASAVKRRLDYDNVAIFIRDRETEELVLSAVSGTGERQVERGLRLSPGVGIVGSCAKSNKVEYSPDVQADDRYTQMWDSDARSELVIPLRSRGVVLGVLDIQMNVSDAFRSEDVAAAESLAGLLSVAVQNALSYGEAQARARRIAATKEIARVVGSTLVFDTILRLVSEALVSFTSVDAVVVVNSSPDAQRADHAVMEVGDGGALSVRWLKGLRLEGSILGPAVRKRTPITYGDVSSHANDCELAEALTESGVVSLAAVPIIAESEPIGALSVGSRTGRRFSNADLEFLSDVAVHLAMAMTNARLYDDVRTAYDKVRAAQDQLVQSEKLRALGEMAGGVAHDFNNRLAAIMGAVQILSRSVQDKKHAKWLRIIETEASDAAETVRRIQEFTRTRRGGEFVRVDVPAVLRDVVEVTRMRWETGPVGSRNIEVELNMDPVPSVAGNPAELKEVFSNLLINSLDAMPDGGKIKLECTIAGGWVVVSVQDTGSGISPDLRRRVFEPFFTTKGPEGTGLGLSVAYGIVTRHSGTIAVESTDEGTLFTVSLPIDETARVQRLAPSAIAVERSMKILVVDDEKSICDVLSEILTADGHSVVIATNGKKGLSLFKTGEYDAVFTDLGMPGLSGWELAESIRQRDEVVPIVFVTGWGDQLDSTRMSEVGVCAVLAKPFNTTDVQRVIAQFGSETNDEN